MLMGAEVRLLRDSQLFPRFLSLLMDENREENC